MKKPVSYRTCIHLCLYTCPWSSYDVRGKMGIGMRNSFEWGNPIGLHGWALFARKINTLGRMNVASAVNTETADLGFRRHKTRAVCARRSIPIRREKPDRGGRVLWLCVQWREYGRSLSGTCRCTSVVARCSCPGQEFMRVTLARAPGDRIRVKRRVIYILYLKSCWCVSCTVHHESFIVGWRDIRGKAVAYFTGAKEKGAGRRRASFNAPSASPSEFSFPHLQCPTPPHRLALFFLPWLLGLWTKMRHRVKVS